MFENVPLKDSSRLSYSFLIYIVKTGCLNNLKRIHTIAMTTNGLTLLKCLPELREAGLNALNVSLDTLQEKKFETITRRKGWSKVMAGIDYALEMGFNPVKVIFLNVYLAGGDGKFLKF